MSGRKRAADNTPERLSDDETESFSFVSYVVGMRLMKLKKVILVEVLAQYGVHLRAGATKEEIADALAVQLLYETDNDESDQSNAEEDFPIPPRDQVVAVAPFFEEEEEEEVDFVGESSLAERDALLRKNAVTIE